MARKICKIDALMQNERHFVSITFRTLMHTTQSSSKSIKLYTLLSDIFKLRNVRQKLLSTNPLVLSLNLSGLCEGPAAPLPHRGRGEGDVFELRGLRPPRGPPRHRHVQPQGVPQHPALRGHLQAPLPEHALLR